MRPFNDPLCMVPRARCMRGGLLGDLEMPHSVLLVFQKGVCDRAVACVFRNEELIEKEKERKRQRSYFQRVKDCEKLVRS